MKAFHFRLDRVERWRRQIVAEKRREHEIAALAAAQAEEALGEHDDFTRRYLEELVQRRREGTTAIEMLLASEQMRHSLSARRAVLERRCQEALVRAQATLERLVEARRDLRALETLRANRLARWRHEVDLEAQKLADEAHRARLLLGRAREAENAPVSGDGGKKA
jgi:flagellar biosynthesis chaperone FliJ